MNFVFTDGETGDKNPVSLLLDGGKEINMADARDLSGSNVLVRCAALIALMRRFESVLSIAKSNL